MSNQEPLLNTKNWIIGGTALIIGLFIASILISGTLQDFINTEDTDPTFYNTGNPDDMTKKELKEYLQWKEDQRQKEDNKLKVFD